MDSQYKAPTGSTKPGPSLKRTGNNPPVIIDGGSLFVASAVKFTATEGGPSSRPWVHVQGEDASSYPPVYGHAEQVRVANDDGELYYDSGMFDGEELQVNIWMDTVSREVDGDVFYDGHLPIESQFAFFDGSGTGSSFVIQYADRLEDPSDNFKGDRNRPRYKSDRVPAGGDRKPFRLAKVEVSLGGTVVFNSETSLKQPPKGFRVIIWLKDASVTRK